MILKNMLALLILSFSYSSVWAQGPMPSSLRIMGRGIQDRESQDILLIACVGETDRNGVPDCEHQRLVLVKQRTANWLGSSFPAINTIQVKRALLKSLSSQDIEDIFSFFSQKYIYAFEDQQGWNWTYSPLEVNHKVYKSVAAQYIYFAAILENAQNFKPNEETAIQRPKSNADADDLVAYVNAVNRSNEKIYLDEEIKRKDERKDQKADTSTHKMQSPLVKCLAKLIDHNYGAYEAPAVVNKILEKAVTKDGLSTDQNVINQAISECQEIKMHLRKNKEKNLDPTKLREAYSTKFQNPKIARFIFEMKYPKVRCISDEMIAQAGLVLGFKAGAEIVTCIYSNGNVRHYLGPVLGLGLMFVASVGMEQINHEEKVDRVHGFITHSNNSIAGKAGFVSADGYSDSLDTYIGVGRFTQHDREDETYDVKSVGVGCSMGQFRVSAAFRFFNGKRRWDAVIDLLK